MALVEKVDRRGDSLFAALGGGRTGIVEALVSGQEAPTCRRSRPTIPPSEKPVG